MISVATRDTAHQQDKIVWRLPGCMINCIFSHKFRSTYGRKHPDKYTRVLVPLFLVSRFHQ
jgi:hypothetical protein